MKVSVILKKKGSGEVATIAPDRPVSDAVGLLSEHRIGALVVSANGRSVDGILSERDIVGRLGAEGASMMSHKIEDLMTANVETCIADDTAFDLLGRMTEGRFRHMPVLGSDGAMIGILSIGDVVKARLEEIESENAAMADMLSGEVF
ncbi:MAG: CBS domain-containing protein [Pseudomonadota bacterium]